MALDGAFVQRTLAVTQLLRHWLPMDDLHKRNVFTINQTFAPVDSYIGDKANQCNFQSLPTELSVDAGCTDGNLS